MKHIAEPQHDFGIYLPAGINYIEREGDSLPELYSCGYLPYSGAHNSRNIFYEARSARVVLPEFALSSENRRIAKKFDGVFQKTRIPFAAFIVNETFYDFSLKYFAGKHGEAAMPQARLKAIVESTLITTAITYRAGDSVAAYVLEIEEETMGHYWYSFYDLAYTHQSLGMWLMLDAIRDAQARGLTHYYLGTVYADKALYKTNFEPLEWWDGKMWSRDIRALKDLARL